MATKAAQTGWEKYVEERLAEGEDLRAIADRNFRGYIGALLNHHQSVVVSAWMPRDVGNRSFDVFSDDPLRQMNYHSKVLDACADLMGYSMSTSKRIEMLLANFSLFKKLEPNTSEDGRVAFIVARGSLDADIEDTVSRLHNYREKLAYCVDVRSKFTLKLDRKPSHQGVGFKEVYRASKALNDKYLRRVLGEKFNNNKAGALIVIRHGVTHAQSPSIGRSKRPPSWELDEYGNIVEVTRPADISHDKVVADINTVWRDFILGTEQLYTNDWI